MLSSCRHPSPLAPESPRRGGPVTQAVKYQQICTKSGVLSEEHKYKSTHIYGTYLVRGADDNRKKNRVVQHPTSPRFNPRSPTLRGLANRNNIKPHPPPTCCSLTPSRSLANLASSKASLSWQTPSLPARRSAAPATANCPAALARLASWSKLSDCGPSREHNSNAVRRTWQWQ